MDEAITNVTLRVMERTKIDPQLQNSFNEVFESIFCLHGKSTPKLFTTGGVPFEAEAKLAKDSRRFISLPHNNRIYEHDWGYMSNMMGKVGQRIGQYSVPIDRWVTSVTNDKLGSTECTQ